MNKICMVVPNPMVKGGIAAVVNGYRGSKLEKDFEVIYVESYIDGNKLAKLIKGFQGYLHFVKVLLIDKPDLIHIHSSFGASFYRKLPFIILSLWARKPIINHIHGADFNKFYHDASDKKKKLIKAVYGKCNKIIALSSEWREWLGEIVPKEKIVIVENYSVIREEACNERKDRSCNNQVLFLGEIGRRKGCYDIPDVIESVAKIIPNVKFILCGTGNEEDVAAIKELVSQKGLENKVCFPGWVRDEKKDELLRESDVFFLPSYNEGMPMSVLDAMGYGLPIVSTKVGGIPKIVHDNENGVCCAAGDVSSFSKGIVTLLQNDKLRLDAADASMKIVKEGYSLEQHLKKLKRVYEENVQ